MVRGALHASHMKFHNLTLDILYAKSHLKMASNLPMQAVELACEDARVAVVTAFAAMRTGFSELPNQRCCSQADHQCPATVARKTVNQTNYVHIQSPC